MAITSTLFLKLLQPELQLRKIPFFVNHDQLNLAALPTHPAQHQLVFVESTAYFSFIPHHQQKLSYMIASQRHFALDCKKQGYVVTYLFGDDGIAALLENWLKKVDGKQWEYMCPSEWDTRKALAAIQPGGKRCANCFFIANPETYVANISKGYRMEYFYRDMRRQTGYLMEGNKPLGGQWNFDKDNRKKLPAGLSIPDLPFFDPDPVTAEVIAGVKDSFSHHFGNHARIRYPVNRQQALAWLEVFIRERLPLFGPYEDAIEVTQPFLFHAVISLLMNNGLLLPTEICELAIQAYQEGKAPLASVEGFIRQIIGWREFIRVYYEARMPEVRTANHFGFNRQLPDLYWTGKTKLKCMETAVKPVLEHAYSHHITRLMLLSNFSNLTFTDPAALNNWFWLAYADAYEWVELPNVLGMATFADGGVLASKPYVAGGNYVQKMSNCCKHCHYNVNQKLGEGACPLNYLYWNFVQTFPEVFSENGRVSFMLNTWNNKPEAEKAMIRAQSEAFIEALSRADA